MVLICGEVGTVFEVCDKQCGPVRGDIQTGACAKCGKSRYSDFRDTTSDEILALGFHSGDYK